MAARPASTAVTASAAKALGETQGGNSPEVRAHEGLTSLRKAFRVSEIARASTDGSNRSDTVTLEQAAAEAIRQRASEIERSKAKLPKAPERKRQATALRELAAWVAAG